MPNTIVINTHVSMRGCLSVAGMIEERFDCAAVECRLSGTWGLVSVAVTLSDGNTDYTKQRIRDSLVIGLRAIAKYEEIWKR